MIEILSAENDYVKGYNRAKEMFGNFYRDVHTVRGRVIMPKKQRDEEMFNFFADCAHIINKSVASSPMYREGFINYMSKREKEFLEQL